MMSCGEPSGDLYAGALAVEIRRRMPEAAIFGLGGQRMMATLERPFSLASIHDTPFCCGRPAAATHVLVGQNALPPPTVLGYSPMRRPARSPEMTRCAVRSSCLDFWVHSKTK